MSINIFPVHVVAGRESKARDMLLNRAIAQKAWKDTILEIIIPTEKEFVSKNGVRKIIDKKIYPGYIFVKMFLDQDTEKIVQSTDGITGFVRSGTKPVPLSPQEVKNLYKSMEESDISAPKSNFKVNDIVLIVAGPFADLLGQIDTIDEIKGKVKAYIQIFGRQTLTELDIQDIVINI
jgi:transcriptional antiterminator NusG